MTETTTLVVASRNKKKIGEIADLLAPHGIQVVGIADFADLPEVVEDGTTFAENAAKKASETAIAINCWVLGEDSGIRIDALDGAPGVYSARYAGEDATDDENNAKMIEALKDVPDEKRGAQYVCHAAVASPAGEIVLSVEATCRGRIAHEPRGTNGFGYDPYFLIPELHRTFGELSPLVKRQLSHRSRAFARLIPQLVGVIRGA